MTEEEQLNLWLEGKSVHDKDTDECCPDFSCCVSELLWPKEKREQFVTALREQQTRQVIKMLVEALEALVKHKGQDGKVTVIG